MCRIRTGTRRCTPAPPGTNRTPSGCASPDPRVRCALAGRRLSSLPLCGPPLRHDGTLPFPEPQLPAPGHEVARRVLPKVHEPAVRCASTAQPGGGEQRLRAVGGADELAVRVGVGDEV